MPRILGQCYRASRDMSEADWLEIGENYNSLLVNQAQARYDLLYQVNPTLRVYAYLMSQHLAAWVDRQPGGPSAWCATRSIDVETFYLHRRDGSRAYTDRAQTRALPNLRHPYFVQWAADWILGRMRNAHGETSRIFVDECVTTVDELAAWRFDEIVEYKGEPLDDRHPRIREAFLFPGRLQRTVQQRGAIARVDVLVNVNSLWAAAGPFREHVREIPHALVEGWLPFTNAEEADGSPFADWWLPHMLALHADTIGTAHRRVLWSKHKVLTERGMMLALAMMHLWRSTSGLAQEECYELAVSDRDELETRWFAALEADLGPAQGPAAWVQNVGTRPFARATAVVKLRPHASSRVDASTASPIPIAGRALRVDGTLGPRADQVILRNNEGAVVFR